MKKVLSLLLVLMMVLSVAACKSGTEEPKPAAENAPAAQTEATAAPAAEAAAEPEAPAFYAGKTINVNIPGSAGGGTDIPTRLFFAYVDKELGCTSVPTNLNAAGGVVCYTQTAQAKADGLTVSCTSCPVFLSSYLTGDLTFNPLEDYEFIGGITASAQVICVPAQSEWTSLEQIIAYATEHPEDLCWEGTAAAGVKQLIRLSLQQATGASFRTLDTDGDNDLVVDLMGGHIDIAAISVSTAATYVASGEIRALAVTGASRSELVPDVPCLSELNYAIPINGTTQIFVMPKGVDEAVLKEMRDAFTKISADENWLKEAAEHNLTPQYLSAEEAYAYAVETMEFLKGTGLYGA